MMLSKYLADLEGRSSKLHMYLCGLRVPEELEGVIEYARVEAEAIFDRVSWLAGEIRFKKIPNSDAPRFPDQAEAMQELFGRLHIEQQEELAKRARSMMEGNRPAPAEAPAPEGRA